MGFRVDGSERPLLVVDRESWKQVGQWSRPLHLCSEYGCDNYRIYACDGRDRLAGRVYHSQWRHQ